MDIGLEIVSIVFELTMLSFIAYIVSGQNYNKNIKCSIVFAALCTGYLLVDILLSYRIIITVKTLIFSFMLLKYIFKNSALKSLFITMLLFVVICISDILTSCIIAVMVNSGYDEYINDYFVIGSFICNFIVLSIMTPIAFVIKNKIRALPKKYWCYMILSPILSCIVLMMLDILLYRAGINNPYFAIVPTLFLLYLNVALFRFFETFSYKIELEILKMRDEMLKSDYLMLNEAEETIRILRHDMKNHLNIIKNYAKEKLNNDLISYVDSLQYDIDNNGTFVYTKNATLDFIINSKGKVAKQNGISYYVKTNIDESIKVDPVDLCTLLGNALDNAIESSMITDDPFIVLSIMEEERMLIIKIKNSANGILTENNRLISVKKDKKNHGLGLKSMRKVVKKYDGVIDYKYEDNVFDLTLFIKNKQFVP